jgi:P-type Mg2+ transporter
VVTDSDGGRVLVTTGAPEAVFSRCTAVPSTAQAALDAEFAAGDRVIGVATGRAARLSVIVTDEERDLRFAGLLVFPDAPKRDAADAVTRLSVLGVTENQAVPTQVCPDLGLAVGEGHPGRSGPRRTRRPATRRRAHHDHGVR